MSSSSIEQLLRARLGTFLTAVNQINSLGFFNIYPTPPPNWPCPKSVTVEIESEVANQADDSEGGDNVHSSNRKIVVKVACQWGAVDPSELAAGIEEKVFTIRDAIEQSLWLLSEYNTSPLQFSRINVTGLYKKYAPGNAYMEAGIITVEFIKHQSWSRDDSLSEILGPDVYEPIISGTEITINWGNVLGATGFKVYISSSPSRPAATASLASTVTTYTFTGLTPETIYYIWIESYNDMMTKTVQIKSTTTTS